MHNNFFTKKSGFTLIEVLIGAFILSIVLIGVYGSFVSVIKTVRAARIKTDAMLLANEQIEIARNLPYQSVGIVAGLPVGLIPREQILTRGGTSFKLTTSLRSIDDPFDGTLGSPTQNDLSPGDYKQMQIDIECLSCAEGVFPLQKIYTTIAPKNLETSTGNGALFVKVFNSNGDPVSAARVQIEKNPTLVDEVTDNNGIFQLVDAPPGALAYKITVTKSGYSSEGTYNITSQNPNPLIPPATVLAGQATQISFAIDKLSQLGIRVVNNACSPLSGVAVQMVGQKKIGQTPDIYKYDQTLVSGGDGLIDLPNLEWDTYKFSLATTSPWFLAGSSAFIPLLVAPDSSSQMTLTATTKEPNALLVSVADSATGLPLSGAEVTIDNQLLITSQGFFNQTDWSGGSGQIIYVNKTMFAETDGNVDFSSVPGELRLRSSLGHYLPTGNLISSIFDSGSTSTQYVSLRFSPADQATSTGAESIRLQIASGNDPATTTWHWLGPDGTASSYYTLANETINPIHNGDQYIRYKLFLQTADDLVTPNISDIGITYTAVCTPPGQAYFQGLAGGTQTISVIRDGYIPYSSTVEINDIWQEFNVSLTSN
jgi:prepilin-type N-terminal cleavage/methylation domain-containing protein